MRPLASLLALVLLMTALIPTGFMPGRNAKSAYSIIICSHLGLQTLHFDKSGHQLPDEKNGGSEKAKPALCPFAAAATLAPAETPAASIAVPEPEVTTAGRPENDRTSALAIATAYEARGPPENLQL